MAGEPPKAIDEVDIRLKGAVAYWLRHTSAIFMNSIISGRPLRYRPKP
jgi:hypothetical protein